MKVEARPARTDVLPHRKTYERYVRIVTPGKHVFRSRVSPFKAFYAMLGIGAAVVSAQMGYGEGAVPRAGGFEIGEMFFYWAGGLVFLLMTAWAVLHNTIVEITPRQISMKRRRFVRWVERQAWDLSSFAEAALQTGVVFGRGTRVPQYWPVLEFDTWDNFRMGEPFASKQDAEEFIGDITASVERARLAPASF